MNNLEVMHPWVRLLSDRFYEEGYASAHFGKWHCLRKHTDCKFTEFKFLEESIPIWPQEDIEKLYCSETDPVFLRYGELVHAATHPCSKDNTGPARITDYSIDFLERFAYRPFFLRVSYLGPHSPVLVPKPHDTMYDPDDIELPGFDYEEFHNRSQVVRSVQKNCIEKRLEDLEGMSAKQATKTHVAYSLGLISHIDDQIGKLLQKVRELGLEQNTVIMFTTDHGGFWGEHGLLEKAGCTLYRNLLQLPLIVSCPGRIPEGEKYEGFIEEVDFYPTLIDFAGISHGYRINGRSYKNAMLKGDDPGRQEVFAEWMGRGRYIASLRDNRWNFIWHSTTNEAELYDLQADPDERFNLGDDERYRDVVNEMMKHLLSKMMNNRDVQIIPDDHEISRSPIYLTPGRDERGHKQALISSFRGYEGKRKEGKINLWPMTFFGSNPASNTKSK